MNRFFSKKNSLKNINSGDHLTQNKIKSFIDHENIKKLTSKVAYWIFFSLQFRLPKIAQN